jgi:hypothetical protein
MFSVRFRACGSDDQRWPSSIKSYCSNPQSGVAPVIEKALILLLVFWTGGSVGILVGWWSLRGLNIHIKVSRRDSDDTAP